MATTLPSPTISPTAASPRFSDVADLLHQLGDIAPERVLMDPPPGCATEADVLRHIEGVPKRLVELVDGALVEKPMGYKESWLATWLIEILSAFVRAHN